MTSAHGNKVRASAVAGMCLSTAALLFGSILTEKRAKVRLQEKKYTAAVTSVQERNIQIQNSSGEK